MDTILAESDSVREFVRRCVKPSTSGQTITVEELVQAYSTFCDSQGWYPVALPTVQKEVADLISEIYDIGKRHDIKTDTGTQQGFKGIECDTNEL